MPVIGNVTDNVTVNVSNSKNPEILTYSKQKHDDANKEQSQKGGTK